MKNALPGKPAGHVLVSVVLGRDIDPAVLDSLLPRDARLGPGRVRAAPRSPGERLRLAPKRQRRCLMPFGQRLAAGCLSVVANEPLASGPRRRELLALVHSLGIQEV